jgi:hypothetical protein
MRKVSGAIGILAAGAIVVGSFGMASAVPTGAQSHASHALHGQTGENPDLAPRRASSLPKLVGIVNDDRDIEISNRTPKPGRYKIVVRDSTRSHNWRLYGNGTSISTTVRGTGRWVFRVRLTAGSYRVVCDPHNDDMEFDLIVRR